VSIARDERRKPMDQQDRQGGGHELHRDRDDMRVA
jgi:hypothetical protein